MAPVEAKTGRDQITVMRKRYDAKFKAKVVLEALREFGCKLTLETRISMGVFF